MLDQKSGPLAKFGKKYLAKSFIMKEGEAPDHLYMLIDGEVNIIKDNKIVAQIKADPKAKPLFFGTMAYFLNTKRTATVEANTDCRTIAIPCKSLEKIIRSSPDMALNLLAQMSQDIDRVNRQLTDDKDKSGKLISTMKKQSSELVHLIELVAKNIKKWEVATLAQYAKENAYFDGKSRKYDEKNMDDYLRQLLVDERKRKFRESKS